MRRLSVWTSLCLVAMAGCGGGDGGSEATCVAGETRCGTSGVEACAADGSTWEMVLACGSGSSCQAGECFCDSGLIPGQDGCIEQPLEACADGFGPKPDLGGCYPTVSECDPGLALNGVACFTAGVSECATGFVLRPEREGCEVLAECDGSGTLGVGWQLCEPTSSECVDGVKWPEIEAGDWAGVVYVDGSADAAGDGSAAAPLRTLQDAMAAVPGGGLIAVAKGSYAGGIVVDKGVTILGVCASGVVVNSGVAVKLEAWNEAQTFAFSVQTADPVRLQGLSVVGATGEGAEALSGILAGAGTELSVSDVTMQGLVGACVALVDVKSAVVDHLDCIEPLALETSPLGPSGVGVYSEGAAEGVEIRGSRFFKVQGFDIWLKTSGGAVTGNWFEGRGVWSGQEPMGVRVDDSPELVTISGNRFKDKMQHALYSKESNVAFVGNRVDGLISDYEDINGPAVKVVDSDAQVEGNYLVGNQFGGVLFERSKGAIRSNVIEGTYPSDPGQKGGDGIVLTACVGEKLPIEQNTLVANTRNGILISGSDALVKGNVVVDTEPSPLAGSDAAGAVNVVAKSTVTVIGNRLVRNRGTGIRFDDSFGEITENEVISVEAHPLGGCAAGIRILDSYLGNVVGNLVQAVKGTGILVAGGKVKMLGNNRVQDSKQTGLGPGVGIRVEKSNTDVERNVVNGADDVGIWAEEISGAVRFNTVTECGLKSGVGGMVVGHVVNPPLELLGNTLQGNAGRGLVAVDVYGQLKSNVVADTTPFEDQGGVGIWVQGQGEISLSRNRVTGGNAAGVLLVNAPSVTIGSTLVENVKAGKLPFEGKEQSAGEGILILQGSVATIVNCLVVGAAGSGLYIATAAEGALANCEIRGNGAYGAEAAGTLGVEGTRFDGNVAGEVLENAERKVGVDPLEEPALCGAE